MGAAKMTLIGMYNYDNTIFDSLVLPTGINKADFTQSLLLKDGEFEVLYPDPTFMKSAIQLWGKKWYRTFSEWYRGTEEKFNPIYNYDRFEESRDEDRKKFDSKTLADYTDKRTANLTDERTADLTDERTADLTDKRTANLEDKRTADLNEKTTFDHSDTSTQLENSITEHKVSAYDSNTYQPSSQDIVDGGSSRNDHTGTVDNDTSGTDTMKHTGTDTTNTTGTDTMKHTGTDTSKQTGTDTKNVTGTLQDNSGSEQNTNLHSAHMYGNIGVTTSAAMLKEFYEISAWNLLDHMCDVFTSELLLAVY